jgi:hypothetical protein
MRPKPLRSFAIATRIKPASTGVDLMLKIGTALLMTFAATLVLVHAEAYFAPSLIVF